jgi:hypothetical protein
MPLMLPRLPRVVRIAYRLAETGGFENLGVIERELAVLGFAEEIRPLAIPVFDGHNCFIAGTSVAARHPTGARK